MGNFSSRVNNNLKEIKTTIKDSLDIDEKKYEEYLNSEKIVSLQINKIICLNEKMNNLILIGKMSVKHCESGTIALMNTLEEQNKSTNIIHKSILESQKHKKNEINNSVSEIKKDRNNYSQMRNINDFVKFYSYLFRIQNLNYLIHREINKNKKNMMTFETTTEIIEQKIIFVIQINESN